MGESVTLGLDEQRNENDEDAAPPPHDSSPLAADVDPTFVEPDAESFIPSPKRPPTAFQKPPSPGSGMLGMVVATMMLLLSTASWNGAIKEPLAATFSDLKTPHLWWHFVTALFAHGDIDHWMHNAPPFLFFAWLLRGYFGRLAFPLLAFLGGIISNIWTVWLYGDATRLVGASGMVYSMVASWLVLYVTFDKTRNHSHRIMRAVGFALILFFPKTFEPRVSYSAHLTGFAFGAVGALILIPVFRRLAPPGTLK